jgi:hypothetical protein
MPRPRLEVCPSPTGRNAERLFLLKLPRGADVKGALDSVNRTMRRHGRDADLGEHDGLRGKLEALLQHHIDEDRVGEALEDLAEIFGDRKVYGDRHEADDETEHPALAKMRSFLTDKGASDEEVDELFEMLERDEMLPHNAFGGQGGRVHEDRHRADDRHRRGADRRRMAGDATDSFNRFYPGAARIQVM